MKKLLFVFLMILLSFTLFLPVAAEGEVGEAFKEKLEGLSESERKTVINALENTDAALINENLVDAFVLASKALSYEGLQTRSTGNPGIRSIYSVNSAALLQLSEKYRVSYGALMGVGEVKAGENVTSYVKGSELAVDYANGKFECITDNSAFVLVFDSEGDPSATNLYIEENNKEKRFAFTTMFDSTTEAELYDGVGLVYRAFITVFVEGNAHTLYVEAEGDTFGNETAIYGEATTLYEIAYYFKNEYKENGVLIFTDSPILNRIEKIVKGELSVGGTIVLTKNASGETVYPYCDVVKDYFKDSQGAYGVNSTSLISKYTSAWSNYKSLNKTREPAVDITLSWTCEDDVDFYRLTYGVGKNYDNAITVTLGKEENGYALRNLYKACTYYWKLEAVLTDGTIEGAVGHFETTDIGPRVISVLGKDTNGDGVADGGYNIRDLGGYVNAAGTRTLQGLLYRSAAFNETTVTSLETGYYLTEEGIDTLVNGLGIKTDLDLRYGANVGETLSDGSIVYPPLGESVQWKLIAAGPYEALFKYDVVGYERDAENGTYVFVETSSGSDSLTVAGGSTLTGKYVHKTLLSSDETAYAENGETVYFFRTVANVRMSTAYCSILEFLSDSANYPVIFHCAGGADRGGTTAFTLGAVIGYDDETLIRDYEMTTFSGIGTRKKDGRVDASGGFYLVLEMLAQVEGTTLAEKVENIALAGGVSQLTIDNIRAIMTGGITTATASADCTYYIPSAMSMDMTVSLYSYADKTVSSVTLNGKNIAFELQDGKLVLSRSDVMALDLESGEVHGLVTFKEGSDASFTFRYQSDNVVYADDLFNFGDSEVIVLDKTTDPSGSAPKIFGRLSSDTALGYGNTVAIHLKKAKATTNDAFGFTIGSYGIYYRAGTRLLVSTNAKGHPSSFEDNCYFHNQTSEYTSKSVAAMDMNLLNRDDAVLFYNVTVTNANQVTCSVVVVAGDAIIYSVDFTVARIADEIASENAKLKFYIRTDAVERVTIFKSLLPHVCSDGYTVPPTCTEDGYTEIGCICGNVSHVTLPATGHNYVDGVCTGCGESEPDVAVSVDRDAINEFIDKNESLTVSVLGADPSTVASITLNGKAVNYTHSAEGLSISVSDMNALDLENGAVTGLVTFNDARTKEFTFVYESVLYAEDIFNFGDNGAIVLDAQTADSTANLHSYPGYHMHSDVAVGYGQYIAVHLYEVYTLEEDYGNSGFAIGSYGFYIRNGFVYDMKRTALNGAITKYSTTAIEMTDCKGNRFFNDENAVLLLRVSLTDSETVTAEMTIYHGDTVAYKGSYTQPRLANEIASADAKFTFAYNSEEKYQPNKMILFKDVDTHAHVYENDRCVVCHVAASFEAVAEKELFNEYFDAKNSLDVTVNGLGDKAVTAVRLNGTAVRFTSTESGVSISGTDVATLDLVSGIVAGEIECDGGAVARFTFVYENVRSAEEFFEFGNEEYVVLDRTTGDTTRKMYEGRSAMMLDGTKSTLGEGEYLMLHLGEACTENTDPQTLTCIMIGNYGVWFRNTTGEYTMTRADGAANIVKAAQYTAAHNDKDIFNDANDARIFIRLSEKDAEGKRTIDYKIYHGDVLVYEAARSVTALEDEDEMDFTLTLSVYTNNSNVESLTVYKD